MTNEPTTHPPGSFRGDPMSDEQIAKIGADANELKSKLDRIRALVEEHQVEDIHGGRTDADHIAPSTILAILDE